MDEGNGRCGEGHEGFWEGPLSEELEDRISRLYAAALEGGALSSVWEPLVPLAIKRYSINSLCSDAVVLQDFLALRTGKSKPLFIVHDIVQFVELNREWIERIRAGDDEAYALFCDMFWLTMVAMHAWRDEAWLYESCFPEDDNLVKQVLGERGQKGGVAIRPPDRSTFRKAMAIGLSYDLVSLETESGLNVRSQAVYTADVAEALANELLDQSMEFDTPKGKVLVIHCGARRTMPVLQAVENLMPGERRPKRGRKPKPKKTSTATEADLVQAVRDQFLPPQEQRLAFKRLVVGLLRSMGLSKKEIASREVAEAFRRLELVEPRTDLTPDPLQETSDHRREILKNTRDHIREIVDYVDAHGVTDSGLVWRFRR